MSVDELKRHRFGSLNLKYSGYTSITIVPIYIKVRTHSGVLHLTENTHSSLLEVRITEEHMKRFSFIHNSLSDS